MVSLQDEGGTIVVNTRLPVYVSLIVLAGSIDQVPPPTSSHIMFNLNGSRKSTPHKNVNLLFQFTIVNNKLTILWELGPPTTIR